MTLQDLDRLIEDHDAAELTPALLRAAPFAPVDQERIEDQLSWLSDMIDLADLGSIRHATLCGAFQALMWARSPDAFAPVD